MVEVVPQVTSILPSGFSCNSQLSPALPGSPRSPFSPCLPLGPSPPFRMTPTESPSQTILYPLPELSSLVMHAKPFLPSFPSAPFVPFFPFLPSFPSAPSFPSSPSLPSMPSVDTQPFSVQVYVLAESATNASAPTLSFSHFESFSNVATVSITVFVVTLVTSSPHAESRVNPTVRPIA